MKKLFFSLMAVAILGASCANPFVKDEAGTEYPTDSTSTAGSTSASTTTVTETPAPPKTTPVSTAPTTGPVTEPANLPTDLTLTKVEAQGNQVVRIEFSVPEELAKTATSYRLMMSKDQNPTVENSTDWYELGSAHRAKTWTVNGTGQRYVKICAVKDNACTAVSSVLAVEVK